MLSANRCHVGVGVGVGEQDGDGDEGRGQPSSAADDDNLKGSQIRRLRVSFGNPALGTYNGHVNIMLPHHHRNFLGANGDDEEAGVVDFGTKRKGRSLRFDEGRIVAMVDVPPEQVPEGVLTLARAHRPWMRHVRIVTTQASSSKVDDGKQEENRFLGLEMGSEETDLDGDGLLCSDTEEHSVHVRPIMTYLVLFELFTREAAQSFVSDLDGRPFTSLQPDVVCRAHHVSAVEGEDGVCIMSPFFAATTNAGKTKADGLSSTTPSSSYSEQSSHSLSLLSKSPSSLMVAAAAVSLSSPPSSETKVNMSSKTATATTATTPSAKFASGLHTSPPGTSGEHYEGQNCAVCLERMEYHASKKSSATSSIDQDAVLTTVCNHSFHIDCLLRWQDSPCPVCRYDHSGLNETLSSCHVCGTTENNYVCLICGVVSCGGNFGTSSSDDIFRGEGNDGSPSGQGSTRIGRNGLTGCSAIVNQCDEDETFSANADETGHATVRDHHHLRQRDRSVNGIQRGSRSSFHTAGHAREHYRETLHAYALDTETQHVWDFAGDGFVHRLIQSAGDGKLVEVTDPQNTSSEERSLSPGLSDAQEGEVVHRKLEGFASQYYTLLKSQLEQQRIYYEACLAEVRREFGADEEKEEVEDRSDDTGLSVVDNSRKAKTGGSTTDLIVALKQQRNQLDQRCMTLRRKQSKVMEDIRFLRNMNESIVENKALMKRQIRDAQRERAEAREMNRKMIPPLEEKVQVLMQQIDGSREVTSSSVACCVVDRGAVASSANDGRKQAARLG